MGMGISNSHEAQGFRGLAQDACACYIKVFNDYLKIGGRTRRKEFWYFCLGNLMIILLVSIVAINIPVLSLVVLAPFGLAMIVPTITASVRRLHDTGRSGWWCLIALIPYAGIVVLLVLCALPGTLGSNRFGDDPGNGEMIKRPQTQKSAMAFFSAVFCLGALAALAGNSGVNDDEGHSQSATITHPVVGVWGSDSFVRDFLYHTPTNTTYGGGGTGKGYRFNKDGSYQSFIVTTGYGLGSLAGWVIDKGKYKIRGDEVILYDVYRTYRNTKNHAKSYENKSVSDERLKYEFIRNDKTDETLLKIQAYIGTDGSVVYDTLSREPGSP